MKGTGSGEFRVAELLGGRDGEDGVVGREALGDRVEVNGGARWNTSQSLSLFSFSISLRDSWDEKKVEGNDSDKSAMRGVSATIKLIILAAPGFTHP